MAEGNPNIGDKIECKTCGEEIDFDWDDDQPAADYLLENYDLYGFYEHRHRLKPIVATIPISVSCPKCCDDTQIDVEIEAKPVWNEDDLERDRDPNVVHFDIIWLRRASRYSSTSLECPFNLLDETDYIDDIEAYFDETIEIPGYERHESIQDINLRIICKTKMNRGYCYIGFDEIRQRLLRPIFRTQSSQCCWPRNSDFHVGTSYTFSVLHHPDVQSSEDPPTPLPHRHDDMLVKEAVMQGQSSDRWVPNVLENIAHINIHEIFPKAAIKQLRFIDENTDCLSVGILKTKESCIRLKYVSEDKPRLILNDRYDLPVTGCDVDKPNFGGQRNALVLLGLGRPYSGKDKEFQPARCYILVLGIFLY